MPHVAFYKALGDWTDWAVRKWTKGPYSHCELVLGDLWVSASPREGRVRFKTMPLDKTVWDFIPLVLDVAHIENILQAAEDEIDCGYDWLGILLTQFINLDRQDPERWFCSELVTYLIQQAGMLPGVVPHQTDPNELFNILGGKHHVRNQKNQSNHAVGIRHYLCPDSNLLYQPQVACLAG